MFDIFGTSNSDDDSSSGLGDAISGIFGAASSAFQSYNLAQAGIVPLSGAPGTYAIQPGSRGQIVQPTKESNLTTGLLFLGALLVGVFAFKSIK